MHVEGAERHICRGRYFRWKYVGKQGHQVRLFNAHNTRGCHSYHILCSEYNLRGHWWKSWGKSLRDFQDKISCRDKEQTCYHDVSPQRARPRSYLSLEPQSFTVSGTSQVFNIRLPQTNYISQFYPSPISWLVEMKVSSQNGDNSYFFDISG